jgi:hypothetical protein
MEYPPDAPGAFERYGMAFVRDAEPPSICHEAETVAAAAATTSERRTAIGYEKKGGRGCTERPGKTGPAYSVAARGGVTKIRRGEFKYLNALTSGGLPRESEMSEGRATRRRDVHCAQARVQTKGRITTHPFFRRRRREGDER